MNAPRRPVTCGVHSPDPQPAAFFPLPGAGADDTESPHADVQYARPAARPRRAVRAAGWTDPTIRGKAHPRHPPGATTSSATRPAARARPVAFLLPGFARLSTDHSELRALVLTRRVSTPQQSRRRPRLRALHRAARRHRCTPPPPIANRERCSATRAWTCSVATVDRLLELHEQQALDFRRTSRSLVL